MPQEIQVPAEWTAFYVGSCILFFAIVAFGVVFTVRSTRHTSVSEKAAWVIVQIVLPLIGFILWLLITSPTKNRQAKDRQAENRPAENRNSRLATVNA